MSTVMRSVIRVNFMVCSKVKYHYHRNIKLEENGTYVRFSDKITIFAASIWQRNGIIPE